MGWGASTGNLWLWSPPDLVMPMVTQACPAAPRHQSGRFISLVNKQAPIGPVLSRNCQCANEILWQRDSEPVALNQIVSMAGEHFRLVLTAAPHSPPFQNGRLEYISCSNPRDLSNNSRNLIIGKTPRNRHKAQDVNGTELGLNRNSIHGQKVQLKQILIEGLNPTSHDTS